MIKLRRDLDSSALADVVGQIFLFFCFVVTITIILGGIIARVSGNEWVLYTRDLQRVLLVAFFSVLPMLQNLLFVAGTSKGAYILMATQFIATATLVVGTLILFREPDAGVTIRKGIIFSIIFLAIYASIFLKNIHDRRLATRINKELDELHRQQNATCDSENVTNNS